MQQKISITVKKHAKFVIDSLCNVNYNIIVHKYKTLEVIENEC